MEAETCAIERELEALERTLEPLAETPARDSAIPPELELDFRQLQGDAFAMFRGDAQAERARLASVAFERAACLARAGRPDAEDDPTGHARWTKVLVSIQLRRHRVLVALGGGGMLVAAAEALRDAACEDPSLEGTREAFEARPDVARALDIDLFAIKVGEHLPDAILDRIGWVVAAPDPSFFLDAPGSPLRGAPEELRDFEDTVRLELRTAEEARARANLVESERPDLFAWFLLWKGASTALFDRTDRRERGRTAITLYDHARALATDAGARAACDLAAGVAAELLLGDIDTARARYGASATCGGEAGYAARAHLVRLDRGVTLTPTAPPRRPPGPGPMTEVYGLMRLEEAQLGLEPFDDLAYVKDAAAVLARNGGPFRGELAELQRVSTQVAESLDLARRTLTKHENLAQLHLMAATRWAVLEPSLPLKERLDRAVQELRLATALKHAPAPARRNARLYLRELLKAQGDLVDAATELEEVLRDTDLPADARRELTAELAGLRTPDAALKALASELTQALAAAKGLADKRDALARYSALLARVGLDPPVDDPAPVLVGTLRRLAPAVNLGDRAAVEVFASAAQASLHGAALHQDLRQHSAGTLDVQGRLARQALKLGVDALDHRLGMAAVLLQLTAERGGRLPEQAELEREHARGWWKVQPSPPPVAQVPAPRLPQVAPDGGLLDRPFFVDSTRTDLERGVRAWLRAWSGALLARRLELARDVATAERTLDEALARSLEQTLEVAATANALEPTQTASSFDPATAPLTHPGWTSAPGACRSPRLVRIGELRYTAKVAGHDVALVYPALVPLVGARGVQIKARGAALTWANEALAGLLLRVAATLPGGLVRFTLVDVTGRGQSFKALSDLSPLVRGELVWDQPRQAARAIADFSAQLSVVIQRCLGNRHADLESYNASAAIPEPYRVLAIAGFPAGIDRESADLLVGIAQNGPRAGMYVMLSQNLELAAPHGFAQPDLDRELTLLQGGAAERELVPPPSFPGRGTIVVDPLPDPAFAARLAEVVNATAAERSQVRVDLSEFLPAKPWTADASRGVSVPIGWAGPGREQRFELGCSYDPSRTPVHHALLAGRTGAGKSVLLHAIVLALAHAYSPDEVRLYLVDFKEGVEFEPYRDLPHARVVAIESEREFGVSVLQGLVDELARRGKAFKEAGVTNLADLRTRRPPRIVLIVDEFQVFFDRSDRLSMQAQQMFDQLCRQGRSVGIHVVLASQTISTTGAGELEPGTLAQIGLRIALALSDADSRKVLAQDNDAARHLERAGAAIYNHLAGEVAGNQRFQGAFVTPEARRRLVESLAARATARPIVFEGNKPARVEANGAFMRLLEGVRPTRAAAITPMWLGEPVAVQTEHAAFLLRRQSRANLLVVGGEEATALSMLLSALVSLGLQHPPNTVTIFALDLTNVGDPLHGRLDLLRRLPQQVTVGKRRDVPRLVTAAHDLLAARAAQADAGEVLPEAPVVLAIFGLQRSRDLVRDGAALTGVAKQLARALRDGPDLGVHVLAWADSHGSVLRVLEGKDVSEFNVRVAIRGGDSVRLLGDLGAQVKEIRANTGLLFDQERPQDLVKLRCYGPEATGAFDRALAVAGGGS